MYHLLFYDYVDNIVERRQPFRADHLVLVNEYHDRGELLLAGPWTDPIDGAVFLFRGVERAVVEEFALRDPYVQNGLVPGWRVREWTVVVGGEAE